MTKNRLKKNKIKKILFPNEYLKKNFFIPIHLNSSHSYIKNKNYIKSCFF